MLLANDMRQDLTTWAMVSQCSQLLSGMQ